MMDKYNNIETSTMSVWSPVPMLENCDYKYSRIFSLNKPSQQPIKKENFDQESSK
jgi:hypothetical protein